MAARAAFVRNLFGAGGPLTILGARVAGATEEQDVGNILELTGGNFRLLATDKAMVATVAFAAAKIRSGDRAGYYPLWVPRPGDVWRLLRDADDTDDNPAIGTAVYISAQDEVTTVAGTNIVGHIADDGHYPRQGHTSVDGAPDEGTTLRALVEYHITIKAACSYWAAIQVA